MNDRMDIASQIGALAVHVDARRWDALLELFAPQVQADWTSLAASLKPWRASSSSPTGGSCFRDLRERRT
jgi:hypothetical protein